LLFNDPKIGQSQYGDFFLYAVKNGNGEEYSFFAPEEVHAKLSKLKKGNKVQITKTAEQNGKKIITTFDVKVISNGKASDDKSVTSPPANGKDNYYEVMLTSCRDAMKIQSELGGMFDAKSIAVTLFIARTKINGNGYGGEIK
jgi:hypothetical protein